MLHVVKQVGHLLWWESKVKVVRGQVVVIYVCTYLNQHVRNVMCECDCRPNLEHPCDMADCQQGDGGKMAGKVYPCMSSILGTRERKWAGRSAVTTCTLFTDIPFLWC